MPIYTVDDADVMLPNEGSYWVAPNATLIGKVQLGGECSIWFNAVLRADNEPIVVGARSNIQDGCVIHVDPGFPVLIENDCTIGHLAMLHGCTVERGSLVGIGAIILNGARIGAGSLIGAGALITEGQQIPPGSLVLGRPGKIVRQLTREDTARITQGVAGYVERWKRYAKTLRQV